MRDWFKEYNKGDYIFFILTYILITYTNNNYYAKNRSVLFFTIPIIVIFAIDSLLKNPPQYPKYLITTMILVLYFISLPNYGTDYANKIMEEKYGDGYWISSYGSEQVSTLNPFKQERYYLFLNQNRKNYLFNADTGQVKETKVDIEWFFKKIATVWIVWIWIIVIFMFLLLWFGMPDFEVDLSATIEMTMWIALFLVGFLIYDVAFFAL